MKEVVLPSGAVLKIGHIPFDLCNSLKKAVIKEVRSIPMVSQRQLMDLYKEYLCAVLASHEVEHCLWECMKKCIYNNGRGDLKIDKDSFESEQGRTDFTDIQVEVGKDCLLPFGQGLWRALQLMLAQGVENIPQSK